MCIMDEKRACEKESIIDKKLEKNKEVISDYGITSLLNFNLSIYAVLAFLKIKRVFKLIFVMDIPMRTIKSPTNL